MRMNMPFPSCLPNLFKALCESVVLHLSFPLPLLQVFYWSSSSSAALCYLKEPPQVV